MVESKAFSNVYEIKGTLEDIIVEGKKDPISYIINKRVKSEFLNGVTYLYSSEHATWFIHKNNEMYVLRLSELKLTSSHFEMVRDETEAYGIIFKTKTLEGEPFEIKTATLMAI